MKKTIIRTALLTLGATLILAIAVFGIMSFCFPYVMMDFTASLGLESLSGDYAYQEYERSGDLNCLARAFVISAEKKNDRSADERFTTLYGEENSQRRKEFEAYCDSYKVDSSETADAGMGEISMRDYLFGLASSVKYRLAKTSRAQQEACAFAIDRTATSFPKGNPVIYLAVEAAGAEDGDFCKMLLEKMQEKGFENNADYAKIEKLLGRTFK